LDFLRLFVTGLLLSFIGCGFICNHALCATSVPLTVNLSKSVTVDTSGGTPRIAINVGGTTRYATYTSGSGTTTLTFTYDMISGDVDLDGVTLISPIDANGGTLRDSSGNDANLNFTIPDTSGVIINGAVPSGYSATFADDTVTNTNRTALSFTMTSPKLNRTYNYSITSSGGGAPLTGSGTLSASPQTISGINVTGLPDGILTLSLTLTDSLGGIGTASTDTIPMAVLGASLAGHWTFDANDISGVTALDRSGNSYNGTLTNGPVTATGITGNSLDFDGTDDYVPLAISATISAPYTISLWAQTDRAVGLSGIAGSRHGGEHSFDVKFSGGTLVHGDIGNGSSWIDISADASFAYVTATWYHLVYVVTTTGYNLYINGSLATSEAFAASTPLLVDGTHTLRIGNSSSGELHDGKIDDVRIYNTSLTPAQITTLYNTR